MIRRMTATGREHSMNALARRWWAGIHRVRRAVAISALLEASLQLPGVAGEVSYVYDNLGHLMAVIDPVPIPHKPNYRCTWGVAWHCGCCGDRGTLCRIWSGDYGSGRFCGDKRSTRESAS